MVFHWSLSDCKFPQVSGTLLSNLAVLDNVVVWMVFTRPPTSKSSSPFSNPLVIVPNAPITIGIIVTFMFQNFFNSLGRSRDLSFFSHSFSFILWSAEAEKSTILQVLFFLLITLGNNFLLFEFCLDFYNWFRVFLHCWIRKWHPFLSIRSDFCDNLIWKKSDLVTKSITFLWHYQPIFSTHIILNMFLREKNVSQHHDRNINYCKHNGRHW